MTDIFVWTIWAGEGSEPHRTGFTDKDIADYVGRAPEYFLKFNYWFADDQGVPTTPDLFDLYSPEEFDDLIITRMHLGWHEAPSEHQLEAARLINWLYGQEWGRVGGPLHILTDDGNIDDDHLGFCFKEIDNHEYPTVSPKTEEDKEKCRRILELMRPMTREGRAQTIVTAERMPGDY